MPTLKGASASVAIFAAMLVLVLLEFSRQSGEFDKSCWFGFVVQFQNSNPSSSSVDPTSHGLPDVHSRCRRSSFPEPSARPGLGARAFCRREDFIFQLRAFICRLALPPILLSAATSSWAHLASCFFDRSEVSWSCLRHSGYGSRPRAPAMAFRTSRSMRLRYCLGHTVSVAAVLQYIKVRSARSLSSPPWLHTMKSITSVPATFNEPRTKHASPSDLAKTNDF